MKLSRHSHLALVALSLSLPVSALAGDCLPLLQHTLSGTGSAFGGETTVTTVCTDGRVRKTVTHNQEVTPYTDSFRLGTLSADAIKKLAASVAAVAKEKPVITDEKSSCQAQDQAGPHMYTIDAYYLGGDVTKPVAADENAHAYVKYLGGDDCEFNVTHYASKEMNQLQTVLGLFVADEE